MAGVVNRTVGADDAETRLDRWFRRHYPGLSHGRLEKLLRTGQVRVNGKRAAASLRLAAGDEVRVPPLPPAGEGRPSAPDRPARRAIDPEEAAALRARVLHRDADVIVIDKPAGLAVQGGSGTHRHLDGLLDALTFDKPERPRLVHRLDRDTSGVLVLARDALAARRLTALFRTRDVRKIYWAVVVGQPKPAAGRIDLPLAKRVGRPGEGEERMVVDEAEGQPSRTRYRIVDSAGRKASWLELEPLTGRTHQLRVHCAALGTPILGDGKYGGPEAFLSLEGIGRSLHLHARRLVLPHPSGGTLDISAPLPPHMRETFSFFGFDGEAAEA